MLLAPPSAAFRSRRGRIPAGGRREGRWIQSIQTECLNHFVALGEKHFNYLVSSYVNFYLKHRPHQGLDNKPLDGAEPDDDVPSLTSVRSQSWLGGLLQSYSRKAA
jgi:hypothetical protein